jgi:hypothetical protein
MIVRADDFVFQAEVANQVHRPRLRCKETVRAAFNDTAFDCFGRNNAAEFRLALDEKRSDADLGG